VGAESPQSDQPAKAIGRFAGAYRSVREKGVLEAAAGAVVPREDATT